MQNINFQNLGTKSKRIDRFYVTFYNLPENISNVLGRQVSIITRPDISFDVIKISHRRNTYNDFGKVELQPINITFKDDEQSIVSMFLYAQIMRQQSKHVDVFGKIEKGMQYKFGIKVDFLDAMDKVTESYDLQDCFITNITHSEPTTGDDDLADISVTVEFDNINIKVFDQYITLTKGT
jgi:hypothetical protein